MDSVKADLTLLKAAFDDYDASAINDISKRLQRVVSAPEIGDMVQKILRYKMAGAYDEAAALIDGILHGSAE